MSPDIKLGEHAKCGGITVTVPSGSVYGGSVVFCIKCMDEQIQRYKSALESIGVKHDLSASGARECARGALGLLSPGRKATTDG